MPKTRSAPTPIRDLADLTPDPHNANVGTARGRAALERSIRDYGPGRAILIDLHGRIIAGHKTVEQAKALGIRLRVVKTDGTHLIAVQREDLDLATDPRARGLAIADNRVGEINLEWDTAMLKQLLADGLDLSAFWTDAELMKIVGHEPTGLARLPMFPTRLQENPPRQGFFEHEEYLKVRAALPAAFQDVLDFASYSGWRRNEILYLTWAEVDLPGGVIRLSPHRSKTRTGRVLPLSGPLREVLDRRLARRTGDDPRVFRRDGVPVRVWRCALRDACRQAKVPPRLLHDCRRTAARNLIRAGVPERVAMILTGHKTRSVFDRYNIVNERELFSAGERLVTYLNGQRPSDRIPVEKRRRGPRGTSAMPSDITSAPSSVTTH